MSPLILRTLTANDEAAFYDGLNAFADEALSWYTFNWREGMTYAEMLERLRKDTVGEDMKPGWMPNTMLYGFVDGQIVGRFSVRHRLNERLLYRGGHIGYAVAPAFRRRGYAREMFAQGIDFCRDIGLERLLITCRDDNEASWRLIESFGSELENTVFDDIENETVRRYWLDLGLKLNLDSEDR